MTMSTRTKHLTLVAAGLLLASAVPATAQWEVGGFTSKRWVTLERAP